MFLMTVSNEVRHSGTRSPLRQPRLETQGTAACYLLPLLKGLRGIVGPRESPPSLLPCLRSVRAREGEGQKWKGARPRTCVSHLTPSSEVSLPSAPQPLNSTFEEQEAGRRDVPMSSTLELGRTVESPPRASPPQAGRVGLCSAFQKGTKTAAKFARAPVGAPG